MPSTECEMLNNIKAQNVNDQNRKVLNLQFENSDLFRISCLEFRICLKI